MTKRKFLFLSQEALAADVAWQVTKEGHDVRYSISSDIEQDTADGFVKKSHDSKADTEWADIIVFDDIINGMDVKAQKLRQQGKKVVGGTPYVGRLENDREFGQEELKKNGIPIIPYQTFQDFGAAIDFVKKNPREYVIKPSGNIGDIKTLLFVGIEKNGADVISMLETYRRVWANKIKEFQLQQKITGVEVAVGAFFNGNQFVYPININFEHKRLFPGDLGPATGEMGTSMFWSGPNKLFNSTLKKMESALAREGYVGYIDINCIVNGSGIYPLEFTSRFGYPTISIQQEGMITPIGDFLYELASGNDPQLKVKRGFQVGVRLVVPPFPYLDKGIFNAYSKDAGVLFKNKNYDGVHIENVKLVHGEWTLTGTYGFALIVCGTGLTMKQAQEQAYSRINNISIPNMMYRIDIGNRWIEDSDKLHNWGYLREN